MKNKALIILLFVSALGNAQVEVPTGKFNCAITSKDKLTYCINTDTYKFEWVAVLIKGSDIEKQAYLPPDSEFFKEMPAEIIPAWLELEHQVKIWAMEFDSVYVVTGQTQLMRDNQNEPLIHYYKAILKGCQGDGLGFLFSKEESHDHLKKYALTINELEQATQLNFFPSLNNDLQEIFESEFSWQFWPLTQ